MLAQMRFPWEMVSKRSFAWEVYTKKQIATSRIPLATCQLVLDCSYFGTAQVSLEPSSAQNHPCPEWQWRSAQGPQYSHLSAKYSLTLAPCTNNAKSLPTNIVLTNGHLHICWTHEMRSYTTDTNSAPGSNRTATKGEFSTALSSAKREISPIPPWQVRLLTGPYLHLVLFSWCVKWFKDLYQSAVFLFLISPSKVAGLRRWSWKCLANHWQAFPPKVFKKGRKRLR